MNYHRCKCGKREGWESGMPPQPCEGCEECGTTLSGWRGGHRPLEPHMWEPRYNSKTGKQDRRVCTRCHKSEKVEA